ncbi:MAG: peptidylprolyl isomerase [Ruminococcus sp.]|nr:peptidylprolyl isomerase [Ruminococcus sp.]
MIRKITAVLAAVLISASMLTACGSSNSSSGSGDASASDSTVSGSGTESNTSASDSAAEATAEPSFTVDGTAVDTTNLIMCTAEGVEISFERFRYYYYYVLSAYESNYGLSRDNIASDEEIAKTFTDSVKSLIIGDMATAYLAKENDIKLSEEDIAEVDKQIEEIKAQYDSEESYAAALSAAHLTPNAFREMQQLTKLYEKVAAVYTTSDEDFKKVVQDKDRYSRVIHILIPYYCQAEISDESTASEYESYSLYQKNQVKKAAYSELSEEEQNKLKESAKLVAEEALVKAKNGDDFSKLISEYGWDQGMETSPDGYYIDKENSSFVQDFVDAAFSLEENQISDLIESESFGWFIIKRLPIDMDYVEKNLDSMRSTYDKPTLSKVFNEAAEKVEFVEGEYFSKVTATNIT